VAFAPSSIPFLALGSWILIVGWFGFNVMSAQTLQGVSGLVAINSLMAMVGGTVAALVAGRNDPGFLHNGPLAGLVAVCAGSDLMHPIGALATGLVAGGLFVWCFTAAQNRWKIDDVLGVWPLHGVWGVGRHRLRHLRPGGAGWPGRREPGQPVARQLRRVLVALVGGFAVYGLIKAVHGLRLSHEQEFQGADLSLHRIGATSQD
jgi:Amt family ammonium transporter